MIRKHVGEPKIFLSMDSTLTGEVKRRLPSEVGDKEPTNWHCDGGAEGRSCNKKNISNAY